MKRIVVVVEDEQKSELLNQWLDEQNLSIEPIDTFTKTQTQTQLQKVSKKMRLLSVVSLGALLALGGLAFFQMLETDKQKELLKESQQESLLHRKVVEQLQDSIIARERRYEKMLQKNKAAINARQDQDTRQQVSERWRWSN